METTQSNATVKRGVISWYVRTRRFRRGRGGSWSREFNVQTRASIGILKNMPRVDCSVNNSKFIKRKFELLGFFVGREIVFTAPKVGLWAVNSRGFYFARIYVGTFRQLDWQPQSASQATDQCWCVSLFTTAFKSLASFRKWSSSGFCFMFLRLQSLLYFLVFFFQIRVQLQIGTFIFLCDNLQQMSSIAAFATQSKKKKKSCMWNLINFFHINLYYNYCGAGYHELNMSCVLRMRCYGGKWQEAACNWGGGNAGLLD